VTKTLRKETRYGHSYLLDGAKCPGVTTIISKGLPKPALMPWAAKEAALCAINERHLWETMPEASALDWIKNAHRRNRDAAANKGTLVHDLAEKLRDGAEVEVPAELAGHVDAYLTFLNEWQPEPLHIERVVGSRTHRYMGTFDSIERMPDGRVALLDIKTNRSGPFGEVALQLAAYRYAEFILDDDGAEQPMPDVDWCGVVWITDTGYEVYEYRCDEATFRTFLYVAQCARFMDEADTYKSEALPVPNWAEVAA
jgi:hypothetical protein